MYTIDDVKKFMPKVLSALVANKEMLMEMDGKTGDGDLGLTMTQGFTAVNDFIQSYSGTNMSEMFMKASMACNKAAPSTMGTLMSGGIMAVAKYTKGKEGLEDSDLVTLPRIFGQAIMDRGHAKPGDKTILDAIFPMADAVEEAYRNGASLKEAFTAGAEAADKAATATAGMHALSGRAKWLGDRAAEYEDPGARLAAILAKSFLD